MTRLISSLAAALVIGLALLVTLPAGADPATHIGMSAPATTWSQRLSETGPVEARRLFGQLLSPTSTLNLAASEVAAGRYPILSFKVPNNNWAGAASGTYDAQLNALADDLDDMPGDLFVAIHHEPDGDGTPANFAAMQRRVLPILAEPDNVDAGVIANGWWWSPFNQGYTDAEIAAWLPQDVRSLAEVVAADTYQGGTVSNPSQDDGAGKIRRLSEWATRVGVDRLGIGEYNGWTAQAVADAGDAILADPRYVFGAVFNSDNGNLGYVLSGARLEAFQATLAEASGDSEPTTTTTTVATTTTTVPPTTTTSAPPPPTEEELLAEAGARLSQAGDAIAVSDFTGAAGHLHAAGDALEAIE